MLVIILMIWVLPCALIVDPHDAATYLIPSISILGLFYAAMFSIQLLINQGFYKVALWMKLLGPIFCILMNNYKYGSNDSNSMYGFLLGIHYDCMFFAQGVIDQFYNKEIMMYRDELASTALMPLSIGAWILLYSITSPMNTDTGFLFYYPLYSKFDYQALYTTGTW